MRLIIFTVFIGALLLSFYLPKGIADVGEGGDSHGILVECDDVTRENHLYLMNAEKLGLSEDQIKELQKVEGGCDKVCAIDKQKLRVAKAELNELLKSEVIDMKAAEEKIKEISKIQDKLSLRHLKAKVKSMMILDDDQKKLASKLKR